MKILRVLDKKIGEKKYYKYRISIPKDVAENSGLIDKQLKAKTEKKKIIIEKE